MADQYPINNAYRSGSVGGAAGSLFFTIIFSVLAIIVIYYAYRFLYSSSATALTTIMPGKKVADANPGELGSLPTIYEGGEYSVNTWVYINSFNKNYNRVKHVFELRGENFSTLLIGLGAFKNSLVVRTHTKDLAESFVGVDRGNTTEAFQATTTPTLTNSANTLDAAAIKTLFTPNLSDSQLAAGSGQQQCDLPEIDLQKWTMVTVVLSGRNTEVYLDGKLARSCVASSYFKVDPKGVNPVVAGFSANPTRDAVYGGGFDGYVASIGAANRSLNPDEIYRLYLAGPGDKSAANIPAWVYNLFTGGENFTNQS